jgi:threonine dehydratase
MLPVMEPPTFDDVLAARETIAPHVHRTPLLLHPLLAARLGAEAWVKHENHQVTGAFKVRGGVNLVATLSDDERRRGLICVTRGNHGQSLAYAGRRFGVRVVIVVPEGNNPEKNAAMEAYGGELIVRGRDFNDAMAAAEDPRTSRRSSPAWEPTGSRSLMISPSRTTSSFRSAWAAASAASAPWPSIIRVAQRSSASRPSAPPR